MVEIFIHKNEVALERSSNITISSLGWFITFVITLLISYIGWNIDAFQLLYDLLIKGNLFIKLIIFSVAFTVVFLSYKIGIFIGNIQKVKSLITKILFMNETDKITKSLNQLYIAKVFPDGWILEVEVDELQGILKLIKISK